MDAAAAFFATGHGQWLLVALSGLLAALLAHQLTPVAMRGARQYGLVDLPDGKLKRQAQPVPYLGGAAVYLAFLVALGITYSFSREEQDKHYLSDVVAGAALGYIVGRTVVRVNGRPIEDGSRRGAALCVAPIVARHARGVQPCRSLLEKARHDRGHRVSEAVP